MVMPRFLIGTTLSKSALTDAINNLGINMEMVAPERQTKGRLTVDVILTPQRVIAMPALRSVVMEIDGVEDALPVPDVEPG
jgi:hypothetical protein